MSINHKKKRIIFVSTIFATSILALFFIISNFRNNIVFFYSPSEIKTLGEAKKQRRIRVGGLVVEKSIKKIDALNTEFVITDLKENLEISYNGILPDLFREKQGVVAEGKLEGEKFVASQLLVKHDEKYMPPEVAKSLKS